MPKVTKRPSGLWQTQVRVGTESGRPVYRTIYGKTKAEAETKLKEIIAQLQSGTYAEPSKITLGQWLTEWISGRPNIRQSTRAFYESLIRTHIIPALGDKKLSKLTTRDIQKLLNEKLENGAVKGGGLSPATVRYIHVSIKAALKQAVKERLLVVNPADAVELPKDKPKEMQTLSLDQVKKFLEVARDDPYFTAYLLDLSTGIRRGELLGLWWDDIDFENATLAIRRQLSKRAKASEKFPDRLFFSEPKTQMGRRQISLPTNVMQALKEHRKRQSETRLVMGGAYQNPNLVFATLEGKPCDPDNFSRSFKRILKKAGVPEIRFHDLRHTYATLALQAGVSPKTIQAILGHSNISTTLDTYGHVTQEMHKEAAELIGGILKNNTNQ